MTGTICTEEKTMNIEVAKPGELTELVRGNEQRLIDEIKPLVRCPERVARPAHRWSALTRPALRR